MRKFLLKNVLTFSLLFFSMVSAMAQDVTYSKETFVFGNTTLPYRKAILPGVKDKASLVVYLHGGSSKGSDNEKQLEEPAVSSICSWLINNSHKAIILVPQCPKDKTWIGTMLGTVRALIRQYIDKGLVDDSKVYLLGGSMGGTGTWNMMAAYPDLFAATMPVAGNPSGLDAVKVAQTPFYTVMGTADVILDISAVAAFLSDMKSYNATYCFDIEQGWTHEDVCKKSYTNERLSWLFSGSSVKCMDEIT